MTLTLSRPEPAVVNRRRARRSRLHAFEARSAPYAYIAPFFLLFAAFGLFPLIDTAWISLHRYRLGSSMSFIGLDNFVWLFTNPAFYNAPNPARTTSSDVSSSLLEV